MARRSRRSVMGRVSGGFGKSASAMGLKSKVKTGPTTSKRPKNAAIFTTYTVYNIAAAHRFGSHKPRLRLEERTRQALRHEAHRVEADDKDSASKQSRSPSRPLVRVIYLVSIQTAQRPNARLETQADSVSAIVKLCLRHVGCGQRLDLHALDDACVAS